MRIMLIGVHYCEGKYRATKNVEQMLKSVGHELVAAPAEGATVRQSTAKATASPWLSSVVILYRAQSVASILLGCGSRFRTTSSTPLI